MKDKINYLFIMALYIFRLLLNKGGNWQAKFKIIQFNLKINYVISYFDFLIKKYFLNFNYLTKFRNQ